MANPRDPLSLFQDQMMTSQDNDRWELEGKDARKDEELKWVWKVLIPLAELSKWGCVIYFLAP